MSFTSQEPQIATKEDLTAPWSGRKDGSHFYCRICGYQFAEGSIWRWVHCTKVGLPNIMICATCDGDDVVERWKALCDEWDKLAKGKFRFIATMLDDYEDELKRY